jgi:Transcriptional regulatory protein, C terminal
MLRRIAKPDQRQMFRNESRALPRRQAASPQCRRDVALCREPGSSRGFWKYNATINTGLTMSQQTPSGLLSLGRWTAWAWMRSRFIYVLPEQAQRLWNAVRFSAWDIFDRSIDVQVLRLQRKLETDPSAPHVIQTERGVGYVFALPVQPV